MLPKLDQPTHKTKLPSTKDVVVFRPFLVKEEKLLLMAKESDSQREAMEILGQVINNCIVECDTDVEDFTVTDISWMFVQLRARSIGNIATAKYYEPALEKYFDIQVDFDKVIINESSDRTNVVQVNEDVGIELKDITYKDLVKAVDSEADGTVLCIKSVYNGDEVMMANDFTFEELSEWVESLPSTSYKQIQNYLTSAPQIEYKTKIEIEKGKTKEIVLNQLTDFLS